MITSMLDHRNVFKNFINPKNFKFGFIFRCAFFKYQSTRFCFDRWSKWLCLQYSPDLINQIETNREFFGSALEIKELPFLGTFFICGVGMWEASVEFSVSSDGLPLLKKPNEKKTSFTNGVNFDTSTKTKSRFSFL